MNFYTNILYLHKCFTDKNQEYRRLCRMFKKVEDSSDNIVCSFLVFVIFVAMNRFHVHRYTKYNMYKLCLCICSNLGSMSVSNNILPSKSNGIIKMKLRSTLPELKIYFWVYSELIDSTGLNDRILTHFI